MLRKTLLLVAVIAGWIAAPACQPLHAAESRLFLAWHAPYGQPGASDALVTSCDDSSAVDTLYLSFEIGKLRPALTLVNASLYFSPQPGDTLGPFWFFKSGWANQGNMWIDYAPFVADTCLAPWGPRSGDGTVSYDHRSGRGRLDFLYAIPLREGLPLEPGARYCFARVRIQHRRIDLEGCAQPVCVEWDAARLTFATKRQMDITQGAHRTVTWNAPPGGGCGGRRQAPRPWQPKPQGTSPGR